MPLMMGNRAGKCVMQLKVRVLNGGQFYMGGKIMEWNNKTAILLFIILVFAGAADIKYKGLLFRLLPQTVQEKLVNI